MIKPTITNTENYPIIKSTDYFNATISINNSSFVNISISVTYYRFSTEFYALFLSGSNFYVTNTQCVDIRFELVINQLIQTIFYSWHVADADGALRHSIFQNWSFDNIYADVIYFAKWSLNDVKLIISMRHI